MANPDHFYYRVCCYINQNGFSVDCNDDTSKMFKLVQKDDIIIISEWYLEIPEPTYEQLNKITLEELREYLVDKKRLHDLTNRQLLNIIEQMCSQLNIPILTLIDNAIRENLPSSLQENTR